MNARCLIIMIVTESLILLFTPDILFQSWVVDIGISIMLDAIDSIVSIDLFLAYRVIFRPFHQHFQLP